jgi:hypothetical protein
MIKKKKLYPGDIKMKRDKNGKATHYVAQTNKKGKLCWKKSKQH